MKLVYSDEAGDPGYPKYESPCFILTLLYLNVENWGVCFEHLLSTRRKLKQYGLPARLEFHSREFFLNKKPYHDLKLSNKQRIKIIDTFIESISELKNYNVKTINIAIVKKNITDKYNVLDKAYTYGLTRVDTNLYFERQKNENLKEYKYGKFLLLIDDGYL